MARFKDFGTGSNDIVEPISFKLHGEEFICRSAIQGKVLLDLVAKSANDKPSETAAMISNFFSIVLLPESYERFEVLSNDPDRIVSVDLIGDIIEWLVEEYTNRPTQRPEVSSTGE